MSLAEELLDGMTPLTAGGETEPHIIIGADRFITVPEELKRIAVQHDHMIETVTFDCPRYWDNHDMSKMKIYVNYMREDGEKGSDLCTNVTIDETDENLMHFDWTVTGHLSAIYGPIVFLVCIQKVASDGTSANHWNSELCKDLFVSEGLEVESFVASVYPGIITALLTRMDDVEAKTTDEALQGYVENYIENKPAKIQAAVEEHMEENGQTYVNGYMGGVSGQAYIDQATNKYLDENAKKIFGDVVIDNENIYEAFEVEVRDSSVQWYTQWGLDSANIGDVIPEIAPDVTPHIGIYTDTENGTFVCKRQVKAGEILEIVYNDVDGAHISEGDYSEYMLITDYGYKVIDKFSYYDLHYDKYYMFNQDGYIYMSCRYTPTSNLDSSTVLFNIKKQVDKYARVSDLKPHYIDVASVDTSDPVVGDSVIEAFLSGRNIMVLNTSQDVNGKQTYNNVTNVMIPKPGNSNVTLVYYTVSNQAHPPVMLDLASSPYNGLLPHEK